MTVLFKTLRMVKVVSQHFRQVGDEFESAYGGYQRHSAFRCALLAFGGSSPTIWSFVISSDADLVQKKIAQNAVAAGSGWDGPGSTYGIRSFAPCWNIRCHDCYGPKPVWWLPCFRPRVRGLWWHVKKNHYPSIDFISNNHCFKDKFTNLPKDLSNDQRPRGQVPRNHRGAAETSRGKFSDGALRWIGHLPRVVGKCPLGVIF